MPLALLSAPTNLGLRPPEPGGVPGTSKAPEAMREAGLHRRLIERGARDAGVVLPGRYVDDDDRRAPDRVRNQDAIVAHSRLLGRRIRAAIDGGDTPLVLGGDCSILLGAGLAMAGTGAGLVHVDGHTDFRHPGNSDACASVAGEDLAAAIGLHRPELSDIDGRGPYVQPEHAVHLGCADDDEYAAEAATRLGLVAPASEILARGIPDTAADTQRIVGANGYWLQIDIDVLDPQWMPAVDSPDPDGLDPAQLTELIALLAPGAAGISVTVFDPDLDPDGRYARLLTDVLGEGLAGLPNGAERVNPVEA